MIAKVLSVVLVAIGVASASISGVAQCKSGLTGLSSFDFDAFSTENGGKWNYKMVPSDSDATAMWLQSTSTGDGKYRATVYKQVGNAAATVNSDQIRESIGNGKVSAKAVSGTNTFEITYLLYTPGKYACFVICSKEGAKSTDAVYVLSNTDLSDSDKTKINQTIKDKGLSVTLKEI